MLLDDKNISIWMDLKQQQKYKHTDGLKIIALQQMWTNATNYKVDSKVKNPKGSKNRKSNFKVAVTVRVANHFENLSKLKYARFKIDFKIPINTYFKPSNTLAHQEKYIREGNICRLQKPEFSGSPISIRSTSTCTNPEHIKAKDIRQEGKVY